MYQRRKNLIVVSLTVALVAVPLILPQVANAATPRCFGKRATIVGTRRADVLKGTSRPDVIVGLAGNDVIRGRGGDDSICGGKGNDAIVGAGGDDVLAGEDGSDELAAGGGGFDVLVGGPGGDSLNGGTGIGDLASYFGAPGPVTVDLAAGTATGDGSDTLTGVEDIDGSRFDDVITGNSASNFLYGEAGTDTLSGGDGIDGLFGLDGDDTLDGGNGQDFASYFYSAGVIVSLTAGTATGEGTDTLANIEDVEGSRQTDTLTGDSGPNVFWALAGNDVIDGSTGVDTVSYLFAQAGVTANLTTATATGEGTDTLTRIENVVGSARNDNLTGDALSNVMRGLAGDDTLSGSDGDDTLTGDEGTDTIDGGTGTDTCDAENEVNCEALIASSGSGGSAGSYLSAEWQRGRARRRG